MQKQHLRLAGVVALLMLTGTLGTACTSSGKPASSPSSSPTAEGVQQPPPDLQAFAACMREHGLTDFPDPTSDGIDLSGTGIDPESSTFKAAQQACDASLPMPEHGSTRTSEPIAAGWKKVVPGGDCECSDGSEFSFWVRKGSPKKVLLFLQGGGACFSEELCDPKGDDIYRPTATGAPGASGIFDFADERNPFADYSVVYVPYCTADVFLGNTTTTYAPDLTIHHKGYVDGTAALDYLATTFADAIDVVVAGESAGSVAAPLYGGLAADRLPDATVTVLADGSGSYPDQPKVNARLASAWVVDDAIRALTGKAGSTKQWSIPGLVTLSGRQHPDVVFARHDYAYDGQQAAWYPKINIPVGDLLSRIYANEKSIESAGVNLSSYTAPGDAHTVLGDQGFYTETVDGQTLVDWVTDLVRDGTVHDVRCTECGADG